MPTFLLEIRTEEIPAAALPGVRHQIAKLFGTRLAEAGFADLEIAAPGKKITISGQAIDFERA